MYKRRKQGTDRRDKLTPIASMKFYPTQINALIRPF